jgi:hypothetical protein
VLHLIPPPFFRDVWRVHSNTPERKGMMAGRGGWVVGALGKRSIPYFCPKLLSRPRYLAVPCNVDEDQACAISTRSIHLSINSWISPDAQVGSRLRTALMVHASPMKGKRVVAGGYWKPNVPQGEKYVPSNSYANFLSRQKL